MKKFKMNEMTKYEKKIGVYTLPDDFSVEVERNENSTNFYLANKAFGDKMYMFGLPDCSEEFEEDIITANVEEYIEYFFERYGDIWDVKTIRRNYNYELF